MPDLGLFGGNFRGNFKLFIYHYLVINQLVNQWHKKVRLAIRYRRISATGLFLNSNLYLTVLFNPRTLKHYFVNSWGIDLIRNKTTNTGAAVPPYTGDTMKWNQLILMWTDCHFVSYKYLMWLLTQPIRSRWRSVQGVTKKRKQKTENYSAEISRGNAS